MAAEFRQSLFFCSWQRYAVSFTTFDDLNDCFRAEKT